MKKLMIAVALVFAFQTNAQVQTPQASPKSEIDQVVGLTTVEVDYYRPAKKGRLVFGDLAPYGKVWRTGAKITLRYNLILPLKLTGKHYRQENTPFLPRQKHKTGKCFFTERQTIGDCLKAGAMIILH